MNCEHDYGRNSLCIHTKFFSLFFQGDKLSKVALASSKDFHLELKEYKMWHEVLGSKCGVC